jgi:hypothetical protein
VDALAQPRHGLGDWVLETADAVHPRAGCVDHVRETDFDRAFPWPSPDGCMDMTAAPKIQAGNAGVVQGGHTLVDTRSHSREHQPCIVGLALVEKPADGEAAGVQRWDEALRAARAH